MVSKKKHQKLKCAVCGYEMVSRAKIPKCYKCGSRRLNEISELSEVKKVAVPVIKKQEQKQEVKRDVPVVEPKKEYVDVVDEDFWG